MNVTEVRVKLMASPQDRLMAFCSITLEDSFVVRDLKIIQGDSGAFVAMPSRKLMDRCPQCSNKNGLRARFCEQCGVELDAARSTSDEGRPKLYADIAHPINARCRRDLERVILKAYDAELVAAEQPGYVCRYEDYGEESFAELAKPSPRNSQLSDGRSGGEDRISERASRTEASRQE